MKEIRFMHSEKIAEGTMAFHFEKPSDFAFRGGQTVDLFLPRLAKPDPQGNKRTFSIASAPFEPDIMIASRMRDSGFKKTLEALKPGDMVSMDGPFGPMTLHNNSAKPAVLLAGGIGITPFRSMSFQAAHEALPHAISLFYSNRRPEDAPFLEALGKLKNPRYRFIPVMTQTPDWKGEKGHIDEAMLRRHLADLATPIYYIAGPPVMVAGFYQLLAKAGIDTDNIRTDEFAGY